MNKSKENPRRQFVSFSFFRVLPEWRRLPLEEREEHRREFAEMIRKWNVSDTMKVLTYSLVGLRGDVDMLLWRICYSASWLQEMMADLLRTRLAGYLENSYSYLGMTRRSQYLISQHDEQPALRGVVRPGGGKYLIVYPLVRTRSWYLLPFEDRQRMVLELVETGNDFPHMRLHVVYSFGLDDYEFVAALETDRLEEIMDRMMRLRECESTPYIHTDTPIFLCAQASIDEMLEALG